MEGDPLLVESFIANAYGRTVYKSIWKDVAFDASGRCCLRVPEMVYASGDSGDWHLNMEIDVDAAKLTYHSIAAEHFMAKVNLDLPGRMTVTDIELTRSTNEAADGSTKMVTGKCAMEFSGVPQLEFDLDVPTGTVNPKDLLVSIAPEMKESLELVSLSRESKVECHGSVAFGGTPRMELQGKLSSEEIRFQKIAVQKAELDWAWNQDVFRWNMVEGQCLGGKLLTTGYFNMGTNTGELIARAERMLLQNVNDMMHMDNVGVRDERGMAAVEVEEAPPQDVKGHLNGRCQVRVYRNWGGRPWQMEGVGRIGIREAELWQVPVMKSLEKLINLTTFRLRPKNLLFQKRSSVGQISSLDADLEFHDTRLIVPAFSTDGTILALSGSGEYSFENDSLYFEVAGEVLRNIGILSFALKPLSWAFQAELSGTREKSEWKVHTALRKIFFSGKPPTSDDP